MPATCLAWLHNSRLYIGLATKIPKHGLKIFPEFLQKCSKNPLKTPKNPILLKKKLGDLCENSIALVGFQLAPSV